MIFLPLLGVLVYMIARPPEDHDGDDARRDLTLEPTGAAVRSGAGGRV